jgi:putative FmdB family regulatory protein
MPSYTYECDKCEYRFETFHSMNEELHNCEKCGTDNTLKRLPQLLTSYSRQKSQREIAGERVERYIEDSRKLLLDSKQELKGKEYKK